VEKIIIPEKEESEKLLGNIHKNNQLRIPIFSVFLILSLILIWKKIRIPWEVVLVILILLTLTILFDFYFQKIGPKRSVTRASREYLIIQIIEVILLLAAIHYWGAIAFGGMAVFMVYLMFCYFAFTQIIYPRLIALFIVVGYITVCSLEYSGIIEAKSALGLVANSIQIPAVFYSNIIFMVGFFICLALYGDIFSKRLRDTINSLLQREKQLQETKTSLEIKVLARTKELEEERASLEEKVKERTRELEEKTKEAEENTRELQEKIIELEKFSELAIDRELKMIELKKEIEGFKKKEKK